MSKNPTRKKTDKPVPRRDEYRKRRERERFFHFAMHKNEDAEYIRALEEMMQTQTLRNIIRFLLDYSGKAI